MIQNFFDITVDAPGKSLTDLSGQLAAEVETRRYGDGLLTLWCKHTGASLLVQANADEEVKADILAFFDRLVPEQTGLYQHAADQLDNAPSHLRALLMQTQISLPVQAGALPLGKVQSLYLFEHRDRGRARTLSAHFMGTRR